MRNRGTTFFIAAHLTTVELWASRALKSWQIQYQTTVLRQIKVCHVSVPRQRWGVNKKQNHKDKKREKTTDCLLFFHSVLSSPSSRRSAAICWKKNACRLSCGGTSSSQLQQSMSFCRDHRTVPSLDMPAWRQPAGTPHIAPGQIHHSQPRRARSRQIALKRTRPDVWDQSAARWRLTHSHVGLFEGVVCAEW